MLFLCVCMYMLDNSPTKYGGKKLQADLEE